ncbi:HAD family hydrolase [uncultured Dysosmobacter sp.]|uniref:HAD family hydrolase n=1 Tax=uncultured Dysosmobacter sp. TaxID=2591384 RepID=UPI00262F4A04|nr:HAD family hydrolase [uncultured Dysosmobacter sp.]
MIDTVLFDMGGTLEDIYTDDASREESAREVLRILAEKGIEVSMDVPTAVKKLAEGWDRYAAYRGPTNRELKPEEIWGNYVLTEFGLDFETVKPFAEELAHMWEVTYYHRSLRPGVAEMLEGLKGMGMKLGVISNTASLYQVFWILKEYGIRDYFQDVTLSSVTGYRKPDPNIFLVSLRQVQSDPATCAYVGDTFSRDVIGPQNVGFAVTFHIHSHLTKSRDKDVPKDVKATYSISDISEVYTILRDQAVQDQAV